MFIQSLPITQSSFQMLWCNWLLAVLLTLASLLSNALGAAWALFMLVGLWQLRQAWAQNKNHPVPSFVGIWVFAALAGFLVKAAVTFFWHDPWAERHGEIRILLGAIATYGAYGYWRARPVQRQTSLVWVSHALSLAALLGLVWVAWQGRARLTSHPIPWAGVMAMFSCWLLALGLDRRFSSAHRHWWLVGSGLAVLAVLASQSRGFFVVVLWWSGVMATQGWRSLRNSSQPWFKRLSIMVASATLLLTLLHTPMLERPIHALEQAVSEAQYALRVPTEGSNSSVGARLYMWQRSVRAIVQSPWLGHGHDGRKHMLKQWAGDANSEEIQRLGHVHNEYLHQLIDHGLPGLLSQIAFLFGLLYTTLQLRRIGSGTAAMALGGILLMYAVGSLSNVNFAHNYFNAGLSLMTGLSIGLLGPPRSPERFSNQH